MTSLVIAEHDNASIKPATLSTVAAAAKIGGDVHVLVAGSGAQGAANGAAKIVGVTKVLLADATELAEGFPCCRRPDAMARRCAWWAIPPSASAHGGSASYSPAPANRQTGKPANRQTGECERAQALRETLKRPQGQAKHLLESEQHLDHCVRVDARSPTLASSGFSSVRQDALVDPHGYIA